MKLKKIKVAVLLSEYPSPPNSGTRVKNFHLWKHFRKNPEIELRVFYLSEQANNENFTGFSEEACLYEKYGFFTKILRYMFFSHHQYRYSKQLESKLINTLKNWSPDVIHAEELKMAKYALKCKIKKTVTLHNVESDLLKKSGSLPIKYFQPLLNWLHYLTLKNYERRVVQSFDKVFTYSKIDTKRLIELYGPRTITTTRNGVNASEIDAGPLVNMDTILFIGSLHYAPNAEGIRWFIKEVIPSIRKDIRIIVAGAGAPEELIDQLNSKKIVFYDSPASLEHIYQNCTLTIVPLLSGSGTRTKILESLAYKRPVISTKKGSEGLSVSDELGVFNAEKPKEFAATINDLCQEHQREKLNTLGAHGRNFVLENYDWEHLSRQYYKEWETL